MYGVLKLPYMCSINIPGTYKSTTLDSRGLFSKHPNLDASGLPIIRSAAMEQTVLNRIATTLLSGNWVGIVITALIAFGLPALLHLLLYKAAPTAVSDDFLLLGPSGSGKTAFCSLVRDALPVLPFSLSC